jgi:hypothetical protein
MSLLQDLFGDIAEGLVTAFTGGQSNGASFGRGSPARGRIENLCTQLAWTVDERDGKGIKLHFNDPLVKTRKVMIYDGDDPLVVFEVYSYAYLPAREVPQEIMGHLLLRNNDMGVGAWGALVDDKGDAFFSVKYYALGDGITAQALKYITAALIKETFEFDKKMHAAGLLRRN